LGESGDSVEPAPAEKDKKKKKLDEIVFGLSAAKGSNVFSPPMSTSKSANQGHSSRDAHSSSHHNQVSSGSNRNPSSPQVSAHSGVRSGTPSPQVSAHQSAKDAQAFAQNFLSNPLLSALSMFNSKDLKDFSRFAAGAASLSSANKKDSARNTSGTIFISHKFVILAM